VKYVCRFAGGGTPDKGNIEYWNGEIPWVSPKDMKSSEIIDTEDHITKAGLDSSPTKLLEAGAVLIVMRSGILRHSIPVAINRVPVTLNQDMWALIPTSTLEPRYLSRLIEGHQRQFLNVWSKEGTTVESLESDLVADTEIAVPPLLQQRAIADYLDHETARLDGLMAAKERVLGLLAEKRRALITRAVTRGLDPRAPLRDSGIPWLGEIPAHWDTRRVAWLFRERDERGQPDLPLLEVSINVGVVLREFSDDRIESTAADFSTYKVARHGDIVFNKMRMWQGAVGVAPEDGRVSPDYTVAAPSGALSSDYAGQLFRTEKFSAECARWSHGIVWDRLRLYWEGFRDIELPLPAQSEQRAIVAHISAETAKLDALRAATERTIALLKERRAALIAAAVTGKLNVQGSERHIAVVAD
jgi:type I restriction enzyme S subunit